MKDLAKRIETCFENPGAYEESAMRADFETLRRALDRGEARAATRLAGGGYRVETWVKKGILLGFRLGVLAPFAPVGESRFFDRDTFPPKRLDLADEIRMVPGGSAIRSGSYLARGVVMMPPSYVNVGAFIDEGTMIDSHVLVGSCAQIGRGVHLSAGVQIGGVLEPIGLNPVILEDGVFVGGNSGIYEGTLVGAGAVIGTGVLLNRSVKVYDLVREQVHQADENFGLAIPPGAVVVSGCRPASGEFARRNGLSIYSPLVIKYRDARTEKAITLEQLLRS